MTSTARSHGLLAAAAVLYAFALSIVLFWPVHVDGDGGLIRFDGVLGWLGGLGVSPEAGYPLVESVANGVLFLPFGLLVALAAERWHPVLRVATAAGLALGFSIAAETAQGLFLPDRTVDPRDVVANTAGAAIGALVPVLVTRARRVARVRSGAAPTR
ncbi:VanZ family protein [Agromyces humatus]|uniref:VanZ family protein n=1 Tax=Agromyces humatus TaxID=279573 RepID=UPI001E308E90|nr:VanZ family protein [Agromyces humatus]